MFTKDRFALSGPAVVGRPKSAASAWTGHSQRCTARSKHDRPLCHGSLTFVEAPAAELKVGLMAVSVSSPDWRDRLLTPCGAARPSQLTRTLAATLHGERERERGSYVGASSSVAHPQGWGCATSFCVERPTPFAKQDSESGWVSPNQGGPSSRRSSNVLRLRRPSAINSTTTLVPTTR